MRSKSRQKARELRTSGKSRLGNENRTRISFTVSKSDTLQGIQDKFPSEPVKCNDMSAVYSQGSYGAKKSESSKTHDTQRQSKHYSGRITRSRGSRQETSEINEPDTTVSCNPKVSYSVWEMGP
ncbi:hypothetical protein L1887_40750 [Cichorium endivia]|nr:hypothetical protein L1887_40750 [Cichorium endivia]